MIIVIELSDERSKSFWWSRQYGGNLVERFFQNRAWLNLGNEKLFAVQYRLTNKLVRCLEPRDKDRYALNFVQRDQRFFSFLRSYDPPCKSLNDPPCNYQLSFVPFSIFSRLFFFFRFFFFFSGFLSKNWTVIILSRGWR